MKWYIFLFCFICFFVLCTPLFLYGEEGIAKRYRRDAGIENDPEVIFVENFEAAHLQEILHRWTANHNSSGMSLTPDVPADSGGSQSLHITSQGGRNTGGYLYKRLYTGYEKLYFRYYIKYASKGTYHHSGGNIGGYHPPTNWPQGGAGTRPAGNERFSIAAEPVNADLRFDFYIYWMGMRASPQGEYWGNTFLQDAKLKVPVDRWMCVEIMVKLNNPVQAFNGELALWIDGRQIIHLREGSPFGRWLWNMFHPNTTEGAPFEGFQWRNDSQLKINWIWLLHYVTEASAGLVGKVWFDDIVLAKSYIGPLNTSQ